MSRHKFQQVELDFFDRCEWSKNRAIRSRKISLETRKHLSILRRALQALPPRELQFLYLKRCKGLVQNETCKIYSVEQQNISYRLNRASERISLHYKIYSLCSETQLRRKLFDLGLSEDSVRIITGVVKTSSQAAIAKLLSVSLGSIRYAYAKALDRMEKECPDSNELKLLKLIERNLCQLRCNAGQERWKWKKSRLGASDVPTSDPIQQVI